MESNDVRPKSKSGQDAEPGFPPVSRLIKVSGIVLKMAMVLVEVVLVEPKV